MSFRRQALLLAAIAVALYANTVWNGYALDDGIVIQSNEFVERGLAGILDILGNDAFHSHYVQMGVDEDQLSGGRYRPLSIVTFAVEQALVGDHAGERHLVNVLLYALTAVLLLQFLRGQLFAGRPDLAFLTALVFVVHPIHTEVVANIKGRDEILCFLFVIVTLQLALSRAAAGKRGLPLAALVVFFLALLSKEYALTLLVLLPLAFYLVSRLDVQTSLLRSIPFAPVAAGYLAMRFAAVGLRRVDTPEILSNPYLYATPVETWATKIAVLLRYPRLLVFPHPLSADYSYRQIPYVDFSNATVWLSVALHVALIVLALRWLRRRHVMAFAVLFYLGNLLLVSNLFVGIGATMGERLAYHASLGFCMGVAWLLLDVWPTRASASNRSLLVGLVGLVVVLAMAKTVSRNFDWKDTPTLFRPGRSRGSRQRAGQRQRQLVLPRTGPDDRGPRGQARAGHPGPDPSGPRDRDPSGVHQRLSQPRAGLVPPRGLRAGGGGLARRERSFPRAPGPGRETLGPVGRVLQPWSRCRIRGALRGGPRVVRAGPGHSTHGTH